MLHRKNRLLHRVCRNCCLSYSTEAPSVLEKEQWPSRCPGCGKVELKIIGTRDLAKVKEFASFGALA
ncbi:MAG TPA: hypothetical protein VJA66_13900 [Thermoanaerobaculia bacterium]